MRDWRTKMSKELEAFELLCRFLVEEINTLRHKDLNEDYFYNKKYGVTMTDKKTGITYTIADIADALINYEELTNKPVILYGRTHGHTQALIDTICKNYKEVKITNLEDEKKLKALEIIKECKEVISLSKEYDEELYTPEEIEKEGGQKYYLTDGSDGYRCYELTKEKYDLLKEVLL